MSFSKYKKELESNEKISRYFWLREVIQSDKALEFKIDNRILIDQYKKNITYLCQSVVDLIRIKVNRPLYLSSGYRTQEVNSLAGGSSTSAHVYGFAVDIKLKNKQEGEGLYGQILAMVENGELLSIDQVILNTEKLYLHVGIRQDQSYNRNYFYKVEKGRMVLENTVSKNNAIKKSSPENHLLGRILESEVEISNLKNRVEEIQKLISHSLTLQHTSKKLDLAE